MIDGNELVNLLNKYKKNSIFHAITVATSLSFLRTGGLKSRKYVSDNRNTCFQTAQSSDNTDKNVGVYDDIFFDVENIWEIKPTCFYGQVVFQYCTQVLVGLDNIAVSRSNPKDWIGVPETQRYFSDVETIRQEKGLFLFGSWPVDEHIMLRHQGNINFDFLERIILYMPPEGTDESLIEERNRPSNAYEELAVECRRLGVCLEKRFVSHESWQGTLEHGNSVGRFYGFRSYVPNVN